MKAIGFYEGKALETPDSFLDVDLKTPQLLSNDVLVQVKAISINPIDIKLRQTTKRQTIPKIIGYDAVGIVTSIGNQVTDFMIGDRVYYAGTTQRDGSYAEFQAVDARLVAIAPRNLSDPEAAALPLTALTAYELLFEKFGLTPVANANANQKILIINGAGGVGSIMSQLAEWSGLEVLATSSPRNFAWLKSYGVKYPLDYHQALQPALEQYGIKRVGYIAALHNIIPYLEQFPDLIEPFGHLGTIVGVEQALSLSIFKNLAVSFDWEYMFAKSDYDYNLASQGQILKTITYLVEQGHLKTTLNHAISTGINAINIKKVTQLVENGQTHGKIVVSGPFNA
ncbi:zinc-binding alcohol dehydrogenase family protein [Weissella coleopterorum]|uniref:Zinc-type alcohol dehydrogenase-like protein n=1 Tax=Weissella coleopterorum TaxID=2714949 RepID=A0A6G8B0F5_9LACO|nr:zinc-binding alcohol dehydrogenase family protein [Weissella coleopterorum]QIL50699.1 zinc-binding alcohol dehydrogenase family protein [Weissella coleopterorum]